MEELIKLLKEESLTCIVEQQHQLYREHASGILPILHMLDQKHLQGAHLADKVIGKAAALLMVRGGVTRVHALILSSHALQIFQRYDVSITYDELVPYIINRARTGMCPMEACVMECDDPVLAEQLLRRKVAQMQKKQNA